MNALIKCVLAVLALAPLCACQKPPPTVEQVTGGNPTTGRRLLLDYGCAACHTIDGIDSPRGLVGPPLANIRQRAVVGGSLPNTPQNIQQWIMHPRQFNPNTAMPELGVTPAQARDIAAYLYSR